MNICRTCGQTEKPTSIVKISNYIVDNGNQIRISDLLFMLTSLKLTENQSFPTNICSICVQQLIQILCFINKCKQTNQSFKTQLIQKSNKLIDNTVKDATTKGKKSNSIGSYINEKMLLQHDKKVDYTYRNSEDNTIALLPEYKNIDILNTEVSNIKINYDEKITQIDNEQNIKFKFKGNENIALDCNKKQIIKNIPKQRKIETKNVYIPKVNVIKNKFDLHIDKNKIVSSANNKNSCGVIKKFRKSEENKSNLSGVILSTSNEIKENAKCMIEKVSNTKDIKSKKTFQDPVKFSLPFNCKVCFTSYISSKELYIHNKKKHNNPFLLYKCDYFGCKSVFQTYTKYCTHSKNHQKRKTDYVCNICKKVFIFLASFTKHYEEHFDEKPKEYICHICNKKLANASSLCIHLRRHNKIYKAICKDCGKGYVTPSDLKTHMVFHSQEKMYQCEYCGKQFQTRYNLQYHKKSQHLKTEPITCSLCPKTFFTKTHLNYHFRRVHAKSEHKYVCQICDRRYFTERELQIHVMMHSGERPLKCTKCPKTYTRSYLLKKHLACHSKPLIQCDACLFFVKPEFYDKHRRGHENKQNNKVAQVSFKSIDEHEAQTEIILSEEALDDFCANIVVETVF